jgi:hypothetical protein
MMRCDISLGSASRRCCGDDPGCENATQVQQIATNRKDELLLATGLTVRRVFVRRPGAFNAGMRRRESRHVSDFQEIFV